MTGRKRGKWSPGPVYLSVKLQKENLSFLILATGLHYLDFRFGQQKVYNRKFLIYFSELSLKNVLFQSGPRL